MERVKGCKAKVIRLILRRKFNSTVFTTPKVTADLTSFKNNGLPCKKYESPQQKVNETQSASIHLPSFITEWWDHIA
jgi:hypothetical protein